VRCATADPAIDTFDPPTAELKRLLIRTLYWTPLVFAFSSYVWCIGWAYRAMLI